jgi:intraflagellar transport protein 81
LSLFRQQAAIIANKKSSKADELAKMIEKYERLSSKENGDALSADNLTGEGFKKFVADLRQKSAEYKTKKNELAFLNNEYGVLERTEAVSDKVKDYLDFSSETT